MARHDSDLKIEGAEILWPNFEGREERYNNAGNRNFLLLLPEEIGERLLNDRNSRGDAWNVKRLKPRGEDELGRMYITVKVGYKYKPPHVVVFTQRNRTPLDEDSVGLIDELEFTNIDLIVTPSDYDVNGKTGRTAYLRTFYGQLYEDELQVKYAYLDELDQAPAAIESAQTPLALPAGSDGVVDADIVDDSGWQQDGDRRAIGR